MNTETIVIKLPSNRCPSCDTGQGYHMFYIKCKGCDVHFYGAVRKNRDPRRDAYCCDNCPGLPPELWHATRRKKYEKQHANPAPNCLIVEAESVTVIED